MNRRKREINDNDYFSDFIIDGEYDDNNIENNLVDIMSEEILSSALNGHKIRNIKDKILELGQDSQVSKYFNLTNQ